MFIDSITIKPVGTTRCSKSSSHGRIFELPLPLPPVGRPWTYFRIPDVCHVRNNKLTFALTHISQKMKSLAFSILVTKSR
jgi:hypothetical protein